MQATAWKAGKLAHEAGLTAMMAGFIVSRMLQNLFVLFVHGDR